MEHKSNEGVLLSDSPRAAARTRPYPWVTYALIAINVAVFLLMVATGVSPVAPGMRDMARWGADFGPLTSDGEWWRLFTAMFLHFGIVHLGLNMYVFYQIGILAEGIFGRVKFLLVYLLAGVAGNLVSLYMHPDSVGAGASGAIFGAYGAFLGFLWVRRSVIPKDALQATTASMAKFLGINLVYGLISPRVDMSAHIGGLLAGMAMGWLLTERTS